MTSYTSGSTGGSSWINTTTGTNTVTWGTGGGGGSGGEYWAGQRTPGSAYVVGALPACKKDGCQAPELAALCRQLSEQERELLEVLQRKEEQVEPTRALWCEQGEHSFSEKDPGMQVMTIQGKDDEGKPVSESRTLCGPCAVKARTNLGKPRNAPSAELPPVD